MDGAERALELARGPSGIPPEGAVSLLRRDPLTQGPRLFAQHCTDCHRYHDAGELGAAPDLTGYGSRAWLAAFISNPAHERFYRDTNDRMPAFAASDETRTLTAAEVELLADWLRDDWYRPAPKVDVQASPAP